MKRVLILIMVMALCLSGCGAKKEPEAEINTNPAEVETSQQQAETVTEPVTEPAEAEVTVVPETEVDPGVTADEDIEAYHSFLGNVEPCLLAKDALGEESVGASYTISELVDASCAYFENEGISYILDSVNSAFIDCGGDGVRELALQVNLKPTEEAEYYDLTQLYILKYMDGEVQLVGSDWGYYRSWVYMNRFGVFNYTGSSSASSYFASTSFVDADGQEQFLFSTDYQMGLAEPAVDYYAIPDSLRPENYPYIEMSASDTEYYCTEGYSFEQYKEGDDYDAYLSGLFYRFTDAEGNETEPSEEMKAIYEEIGLKWYDTETINNMITQRMDALGLTEDALDDMEEPEWEEVVI